MMMMKMKMMRAGVSTICFVAWILIIRLCVVIAFHSTTIERHDIGHAVLTTLFVQPMEPRQKQQRSSSFTNPFFAQGEATSSQEDNDEPSPPVNRSSSTTKRASIPTSPPQHTMFHPKPKPKPPSAGQELLEAVLDVTVAGSMALLVRNEQSCCRT
jgi:hypothetical protein